MSGPQIQMMGIDKVHPYENNAKIHDPKQVEKIAKSIKEFGWRGNPIVVDKEGVIIAGHGRRLAAISLGMAEVPVIVASDLTPEQVRALRLADNRVAVSDIDADLLQRELADLEFDLEGIFDKKELDFLEADLGEMKMDAFVEDLDTEVAAQAAETVKKIEEADEKPVKIEKALGFKSIQGKDERYVARFMAMVEADTGKSGADAFVAYVRAHTTAAALMAED